LGAFVAVAVMAGGLLVVWTVTLNETSRLEENRALSVARTLAYVAARGSDSQLQATLEALGASLGDGLSEAYVLSSGEVDRFGLSLGNRYRTNLDPALVGVDPRRSEDPRQKDLFDRSEAVVGGAEAHLARLAAVPEAGLDGAAPYFEILEETLPDGREALSVTVPVVGPDGTSRGAAGVTVAESAPPAPLPWGLALAVLVLAAGGLFALGFFKSQLTWAPWAMLAGGLAFMVWVGVWLSGWEEGAYRDRVARHAEQANVWLEAARAQSDDQVVDYALRTYRDARATDLESLPFAPEAAARKPTAPLAAGLTFLLMAAGLITLHRFLVRTFRHLAHDPWAYIYIIPSTLGMLLLVFGPFFFGVTLAFHERDADRLVFVGLDNFFRILGGERTGEVTFYWTLVITVIWTAANVVIHLISGLILALILNDQLLRFKRFYRVLLILPWAIPNYITALIWRGLFNTDDGAVNRLLGMVGIDKVDWLGGSTVTAFLANLITNCWLGFPFMMVVALGALQSIPAELYEAADVDGATRWQKFRTITLPLLKPALFPAVILGSIWTFNMFNIIYLVSGGGPNHRTDILITEAYKAFYVLGKWGYAAAYSVIIFLILFGYSTGMNRVSKATEGAFE
jgi:ABC-type sugar transport system permease subunit